MKKKVWLLLLIILLFLLPSCVTKRQQNSWYNYPSVPFFFRYQIDNVSVIINHVHEENITRQVYIIAYTHLESQQKNYQINGKTIFLDINVEQRSFLQNIEMYNSIFISITARDELGNIYARENEYISSKQTFIAAAEQNKIITRILNKFLKDQQNRYNDAQNYERVQQREG